MSELRIGIAAEGKADFEIISAAIDAILSGENRTFRLTLLQPEAVPSRLRQGWTGIANWCEMVSSRHIGSFDDDPFFEGYDIVVIHIDADVATKRYSDENRFFEERATRLRWSTLPCSQPCPPPTGTRTRLEGCIRSWLSGRSLGGKLVLCIPAQSSGTWFAHALMPTGDPVLHGGECDPRIEGRLASLPLGERVKKNTRQYTERIPKITGRWADIKASCTQAERFERDLLAAIGP